MKMGFALLLLRIVSLKKINIVFNIYIYKILNKVKNPESNRGIA